MTLEQLARTDVVTADTEATLTEIARIMTDEGVGSVVVVEPDGRPCGMVTDRDLVTYGIAAGRDPDETIANDVMAFTMVSAEVTDGVLDVISRMADEGVRRMPVMADGELYGIVTLDDFIVLLAGELESLAKVVEAESPPRATGR